jgi:hypothetical protein
MPKEEQKLRLSELRKIPLEARLDHRLFLDSKGNHQILERLPRKERRKLKKAGEKIGQQYHKILKNILESGAGFPTDQLLRQMAFEYTHRYACSGVYTQPVSFNYFEPFCNIKLIPESVAPYAEPTVEENHLFNFSDFFDYLTSPSSQKFDLTELLFLPDGRTYQYTANANVLDFSILNAKGREFVVSGFATVRRGSSLHWYLVGGEVYTEDEWSTLSSALPQVDTNCVNPMKKAFIDSMVKDRKCLHGAPLPLEGTLTAQKTVICGEIDLHTKKHLGRCYLAEHEQAFNLFCDDPEILNDLHSRESDKEPTNNMLGYIEEASALWDLAEGLFQLPYYFSHTEKVPKEVVVKSGKRLTSKKGGKGVALDYKTVSAIEIVDNNRPAVREVLLPHYKTETEGHWRRISKDALGKDQHGNHVKGKTWIKASNKWRDRKSSQTVYVKETVAAAKTKIAEYLEASEKAAKRKSDKNRENELYVMRCPAMGNLVYKVGWTSGSSEERAKQLSSVTGIPLSFIVVEYWPHHKAEALETDVHMILDPYRLNDRREFFCASYDKIKTAIESAIKRAA